MRIGIIGAGVIGATMAKLWVDTPPYNTGMSGRQRRGLFGE
jgi:predicted dinucleotide-binding enzyme